jgi:type III secretory pathway component EscU
MNLFALAAFVVFVLVAIIAFFFTASVVNLLGLLAIGLACLVGASLSNRTVG